jgi:hypothetical protein
VLIDELINRSVRSLEAGENELTNRSVQIQKIEEMNLQTEQFNSEQMQMQ